MKKIIIALGNYGSLYQQTRHNLGFRVLDNYLKHQKIILDKNLKPNLGFFTKKIIRNVIVIFGKPTTMMNNSGFFVKKILATYAKNNPATLLLLHDDLDLKLGNIKITCDASAAGHNGVNSVIEFLNTQQIVRLRLGIGRPQFPESVHDYVLSKFTQEEEKVIETKIFPITLQIINHWITENGEFLQNAYN